MESIIKTFNKGIKLHKSISNKKICFMDIETTGLNRSIHSIYLIGIIFFDEKINNWKIIQLFANELKDEAEVILEAYNIMLNFDLIVNYNGSSFDIPFINNKLAFYKTGLSINIDKSFDLYSIIKSNKNILALKNYRLKTIEEYLGIYRKDSLSGKECIDLYFDYLISGNISAKDAILLHNYEDLYYLLDIMSIIDIMDKKKTFSVNYNNQDNHFIIHKIERKKDYLFIKGDLVNTNMGSLVYYGDNFNISINQDNSFKISLEVKEAMITTNEKCIFIRGIEYNLSDQLFSNYSYKTPKGVILLKVENYYIDNIKLVLSSLINMVINK